MADSRFIVAETTQAQIVSPSCGSTHTTQASGTDTSPLDGSDEYKNLPNGSWIVPFHGSCSRCHHYHKAIQARIKVAHNQIQSSHIHCDNCKDPWVAFSAHNATQISLLSTITTEPDLVANAIRARLIDIVNRATARAANGTLDKPSPPVPIPQASDVAHANDHPGGPSNSTTHSTLSNRHENDVMTESVPQQHQPKPTVGKSKSSSASNKQLGNLSILFSRTKAKMIAHIPMLHRGPRSETLVPSTLSRRQYDKSSVRTLPPVKIEAVAVNDTMLEPQIRAVTGDSYTPERGSAGSSTTEPDKLSDVAIFLASLNRSAVDSMPDGERRRWMRKAYTDFKHRNKRTKVPMELSPIIETSIVGELPRVVGHFNRRSEEVRYTGSHIEDLEFVPPRFSTTSSNAIFDAQLFSDDNTVVNTIITDPGNALQSRLSQLRHGSHVQRPHSMPNAPLSPRLSHRRGHSSFDSRMYRGTESTYSLRGQPASIRSQGSMTLNGSTISLYQTLSEAMRPSETTERPYLDYAYSPLPSPSIFSRDHSESPPPARLNSPENSESMTPGLVPNSPSLEFTGQLSA